MKNKKIYLSIFTLTLCFTICTAQEGETLTKQSESTTIQTTNSKLISPPFSIQIHQSETLKEANNIKSKARRDFTGITSYLKNDNNTYSITLGKFKTLNEAQERLKTIKRKYPQAVLLSNQKE